MAIALAEAAHQDDPVDFSLGEEYRRIRIIAELVRGARFDGGPHGDCWEIREDRVKEDGYGIVIHPFPEIYRDPRRSAHRQSFKAAHPGINVEDLWKEDGKTGLHVHHMCENARCFRPSHLRAVTPEENQKLKRCREPNQRHTCGRYYNVFRFKPGGGPEGSKIERRCSVCEREKNVRCRAKKKRDTNTEKCADARSASIHAPLTVLNP